MFHPEEFRRQLLRAGRAVRLPGGDMPRGIVTPDTDYPLRHPNPEQQAGAGATDAREKEPYADNVIPFSLPVEHV